MDADQPQAGKSAYCKHTGVKKIGGLERSNGCVSGISEEVETSAV